MSSMEETIYDMSLRIEMMEIAIQMLLEERTVRDWYGIKEFAHRVEKAEFTVREWCRHGRIHANKRQTGRGRSHEWMISHEELERYRSEGLLPLSEN